MLVLYVYQLKKLAFVAATFSSFDGISYMYQYIGAICYNEKE